MKSIYFLLIAFLICSCGRKLTMSFSPVNDDYSSAESTLASRSPLTQHTTEVTFQREELGDIELQHSSLITEKKVVSVKELLHAKS